MNEHDKSLKLAELMGYNHRTHFKDMWICGNNYIEDQMWYPYNTSTRGLAQFAAILLKFPEVMPRLCLKNWQQQGMQNVCTIKLRDSVATQANILDEILRMNGVEI